MELDESIANDTRVIQPLAIRGYDVEEISEAVPEVTQIEEIAPYVVHELPQLGSLEIESAVIGSDLAAEVGITIGSIIGSTFSVVFSAAGFIVPIVLLWNCLLYTSDAADE